MRCAI